MLRSVMLFVLASGWGLFTVALSAQAQETWPRFRGPNGAGISDLKGLPTQWTEQDYEWKVELPGVGHSSPVIWKDALFVATSEPTGERSIRCLDALTGKQRWAESTTLGKNSLHKKNSYASSTPAVDEERVYVTFGDDNHHLIQAFSHAGKRVWDYDLGPIDTQHGQGMSPIVYGEAVILCSDQRGPSYVVALDRKSGKEIWKINREIREASYSTPLVYESPGHPPVLICEAGISGHTGLDLQTGKQLWSTGAVELRTCSSLMQAGKLVIGTCGQGGRGKFMWATDPWGNGTEGGKVVYTRDKMLPYVPTPLYVNGRLFYWTDDGMVVCTNAETGEDIWFERVGKNYTGSPIAVDGKIYSISEDGQVGVVDASDTFKFHGFSPIGDDSYSTPAVANGRLYLRGFHTLACLKAKTVN
jgi:outer membrane protein assembly factor BamB